MIFPRAAKAAFFLIFFFSAICGFSQSPHFKCYDVLKGESHGEVNVVFQDSKGLMWIGTTKGLFLFDGINFKQYSEEDNLASNVITCIAEDDKHQIWLGHKRGKVSVLDPENGGTIHHEIDSIFNAEISAIEFLKGGQIVVATLGDGMLIIEDKEYTLHCSRTDGLDDFIYDIKIGLNGVLWLASDAGVLQYSVPSDSWSTLSTKDGLPDNIINNIDFDPSGNCWIGSKEKGLAFLNVGQEKITTIPNWIYGEINSLSVKAENDVWISTQDSGMVRLRIGKNGKHEYSIYNEKVGLLGKKYNSVLRDKYGQMWMGSDKGLCFHSNDFFQFITEKDNLPELEIVALDFDSQGRLWLASPSSLYVGKRNAKSQFEFTKLSKNWDPHLFSSIYTDANSHVWIGTLGNGLYLFDPETLSFSHLKEKDGLSNNNVSSINGDGKTVWITTLGGGVNSCAIEDYSNVKFQQIAKKDGLGSDYIYSSLVDNEGTVWFAKDGGGAASMSNEVVTENEQIKAISNNTYGVIKDQEGSIWFTTANKGLLIFDGDSCEILTTKQGLLSNSYASAAVSQDGLCIFSSNEGITVIDSKTRQINNFGQKEGVAFLKPNLNAITKDSDGSIWIGTNKGIVKFQASKSITEKVAVDVMITSTLVLLNEIKDSSHVLNHDENHLIINYLGLCYSAPEDLQYRYKMVGLDLDWVYAKKSQTARYSGLSAGAYSFIVQATVTDNQWSEADSASIDFVIKPPFWQTLWFVIVCVVVVFLVFMLIIKLREKQFKAAEKQLILEVDRRTEKISLQKSKIENQKNKIQGQNKDITDSIQYAKRIQGAILPSVSLLKASLKDYFLFYQPKDIVAGDFYWIKKINNRVLFAAADCTGHGVPGAMVSVVCHNGLERATTEFELNDPALILDKTRELITNQFMASEEEVQDGMDISLCAIEDGKLHFAGANNSVWVIRENTQTEVVVECVNEVQLKRHEGATHSIWEIKGDKQPVGKFDSYTPFSSKQLNLLPGDTIYIYSDGIPDQFGGEKGKKLKQKGFRDFVLSQQNKELSEQKIAFTQFFESWRGELEQIDDVCLLAVKV